MGTHEDNMRECTTDSNFNTFLLSNFERNFKNRMTVQRIPDLVWNHAALKQRYK